jgi:hypothetical protein
MAKDPICVQVLGEPYNLNSDRKVSSLMRLSAASQ